MTTIPTATFDVSALRTAFANRDAGALLSLYSEDATVELIDSMRTPSDPRRLAGREQLRAHFEDVFSRDMTHAVDIAVASEDALGYSLRCTYAGGMKVVCVSSAELRDGRIAREVGVQAWDA
jgi:ketosteroid isomerase-like protein